MNFSTLKGLTVPEGNVTQIADESGRVLWSTALTGATVKISGGVTVPSLFSITIEGQTFDGDDRAELIVETGTKIDFAIQSNSTYASKIVIGANVIMGTTVASAEKGVGNVTKYTYEVLGDVTIQCSLGMVAGVCVLITEA